MGVAASFVGLFNFCDCLHRPVAMAQQQELATFAAASSPSALLFRSMARSRGSTVPFVAGQPVAMAVSGANWWDKAWRFSDNLMWLTIIAPIGFLKVMNTIKK